MIPRMRLTSEQNGAGEQGRQSGSKWFFDVLQEVNDMTVVILAAEPSTEFQQKVKSIPNLRLIANLDFSPYAREFAQRPPQIARIVKGVAAEVPKHSESFSDFIDGKKAGQP